MKAVLRLTVFTSAAYTLLASRFLWLAFFGRVPNDAGIILLILALPTSLLANIAQFWRLRTAIALLLHQPVTDRLAMSLDAAVGWFMGCVQYSLIALVCSSIWRFIRRRHAP